MKLKLVQEADFRKSEATNMTALLETYAQPFKVDDVVCFISKKRNQIVFVYDFYTIPAPRTGEARILHSERLRLTNSVWNPLMLVNYAEQVGIKIDGLKRFEEYYKELTAKKGG